MTPGPVPVSPPPPPPTQVPQVRVRSEEPSRSCNLFPYKLEDYSPEQGAVILGDWLVRFVHCECHCVARRDYATGSKLLCSVVVFGSCNLPCNPSAGRPGMERYGSRVSMCVVSQRVTVPVGILFLLHTRYQPAGQAEKASILQCLVNPDEVPKDIDLRKTSQHEAFITPFPAALDSEPPHPDHNSILIPSDPRCVLDWTAFLGQWEDYEAFAKTPRAVRLEQRYQDAGVNCDVALLDAWNFRVTHGASPI